MTTRREILTQLTSVFARQPERTVDPPKDGLLVEMPAWKDAPLRDRREVLIGVYAGLVVLAATATLETVRDAFLDINDRSRERWSIRAEKAIGWARLPYNDPELLAQTEEGLNEGEIALLNSYKFQADNANYGLIPRNVQNMQLAGRHTESALARSILFGRIAIDSSLLGDGDSASSAIQQIDFAEVTNLPAAGNVLDNMTSIAFNLIDGADYAHLRRANFSRLIEGWRSLGIDVEHEGNFAQLARSQGANINTILQTRYLARMQRAGPDQMSRIRAEWLLATIEAYRALKTAISPEMAATDFFFTLHRIALHAQLSDDQAQRDSVLDLYLGKRTDLDDKHLVVARENILKAPRVNSRWMLLLQARRELDAGAVDDAASRVAQIAAIVPQSPNHVLRQAIPAMVQQLARVSSRRAPLPTDPWPSAVRRSINDAWYEAIIRRPSTN